jgi:hypothetical protein
LIRRKILEYQLKKQLDHILDIMGYSLGWLAFLSPQIRNRQKGGKAIQSALLMASSLIEDLQRAQREGSDGGEAITLAEFESISHKAILGLQDMLRQMKAPQ